MNFLVKTIQECLFYGNYEVCISCSLFKTKESYRNFEKYTNMFMKWFKNLPDNFYIKLFIDENVLNDEHFVKIFDKRYKNLEIVLFDFPYFKNCENYHDGTFGTIARFLPLFNISKISNSAKYLWISDLDLPYYSIKSKYINEMKKMDIKVSYFSKACYDEPWIDSNEIDYPIVNSRIIIHKSLCGQRFKHLFESFIDDIISNKYNTFKNDLILYLQKYKNKYIDFQPKIFPYGFDELFTNKYLLPEFKKYKRLIYYDLSLINFSHYIELSQKEEYKKLDYDSYKNHKNNNYSNKLKFKSINDSIYINVKDLNIQNERMKICLIDYSKYSNNFVKDEMGFVSLIKI